MDLFYTILITVQVLSAVIIVGLVLLQQGKGADMGAAFGSGSAGSVFGSSGSANFLSRSTAVAATIFLVTTLGLAYLNKSPSIEKMPGGGIMDSIPIEESNSINELDEELDSNKNTAGSMGSSVPE